MEAEKHLCTENKGGKKAQYVPTRPSDTDMHQDKTNVSPTLDKSLLCASLKTNFFVDISAIEAQSLAATA